jgi:hypothetical protein
MRYFEMPPPDLGKFPVEFLGYTVTDLSEDAKKAREAQVD